MRRNKKKKKSTIFNSNITSSLRFLSNLFEYLFSNILLSYLHNIFARYFFSNSPLLKSLFSTIFNFSCLLLYSVSSQTLLLLLLHFINLSFSPIYCFLLWTLSIIPNTSLFPLFFFCLNFSLSPILQLYLFLLVLLLLPSISLLVSYILLLNYHILF